MKKEIQIAGMSCGHCVASVTKALQAVPGVSQVEVSLEKKQAVVEVGPGVQDAQLSQAVENTGFDTLGVVSL